MSLPSQVALNMGLPQVLPRYAMLTQGGQDLLTGLLTELHIFSAA